MFRRPRLLIAGLMTVVGTATGGALLFAGSASANVSQWWITCTSVTFNFSSFNTATAATPVVIAETISINGAQVYSGSYSLTTPVGSNTVPITGQNGQTVVATSSWTLPGDSHSNSSPPTIVTDCNTTVTTQSTTTTLPKSTTTLPKSTTTLPKSTTTLPVTSSTAPEVSTTTVAPTTTTVTPTPGSTPQTPSTTADTPTPTTTPSGLAFTGTDANVVAASGTALIAGGLGLLLLSRRRRKGEEE